MTEAGVVTEVASAPDMGFNLLADRHTHSDLTDGTASPEAMADAAAGAGLRIWGLSDHVRADSSWVPQYIERVRAIRRPGLRIECGVEARILDGRGRLDMPPGLRGLDYVLVADHQFPGPDGPLSPGQVSQLIAGGRLRPSDAVDQLIAATAAALTAAPARPIAAHLLSLLPKIGLDESAVTAEHIDALAAAAHAGGAAVEANEKWRCPGPRILAMLRERDVPLCAGSDAHAIGGVGRWDYVLEAQRALEAHHTTTHP